MPANTPFNLVPNGPRFTPLRYGLLSAAQIVDDVDPHWQIGTKFQRDACDAAHALSTFCVAGGPATGTPTKTPTTTGAPTSAAEPFTVYAYTDCSPVGWGDNLEDLQARAARHLDAGEGRAIERTFWTGDVDQGPEIFPHLAANADVLAIADGSQYQAELQSAATVVNGTATSPKAALAELEGALAACYGGEGVIHMPRRVASLLTENGAIEAQGPQLRTKLGTPVAAYSWPGGEQPSGAAPAAGQLWMYATGAVMLRRSPVKPGTQRPADFVGKADNSTVYVVERTYVIDWDCCHLAINVGFAL